MMPDEGNGRVGISTIDESMLPGARAHDRTRSDPVTAPLQQSRDAMSGEVLRRKVVITDPLGFHLRPLAAFAQRAMQFRSQVTVSKPDLRVNGKSILELMLLAAEQGTELELEVVGEDAPEALEQLAELLGSPGLPEPPEESPPKKG